MPKRPCRLAEALLILAGSSCALAGTPFPATIDLGALSGADGFRIPGIDPSDRSGRSVAGAGDVNGDGVADVIIGAYNGAFGAGECYVIFGGSGVGSGGEVNPAQLNGSNGFLVQGLGSDEDAGIGVSSAGDVNGDGIADLFIGSTSDANGRSRAGECFVVYGSPTLGAGGLLSLGSANPPNGFTINGIDTNDRASRVAAAGDVNGDGLPDLIVGAPSADPLGRTSGGEGYVIFNNASLGSGEFELSSLSGPNGFTVAAAAPDTYAGQEVSSAGDVNGDGFDDVLVAGPAGAFSAYYYSGDAYLIFGGPSGGFPALFDGGALAPGDGVRIASFDDLESSGSAVGHADVNGDGYDDVLVGVRAGDPGGRNAAGFGAVIFGDPASLGLVSTFDVDSVNGANGFAINGIAAGDFAGWSFSSAGDVNGDGVEDVIIGARSADPLGRPSAGAAYVVFGGAGVGSSGAVELGGLDGLNGFALLGAASGDNAGQSVSSAGDLNDDGVDDLIIGADSADPGGDNLAGESYVVFGRSYQRWIGPVPGQFDDAGAWLLGAVPTGGVVIVEPDIGVDVTASPGAMFFRSLRIGAGIGRTTLLTPNGLVLGIDAGLSILDSGAIEGAGTIACSLLTIEGVLGMHEMSAGAPLGTIVEAGARIEATDGLLDSDLFNRGDIVLETTSKSVAKTELEITGFFDNQGTGEVLAVGDTTLRFEGGVTNQGCIDFQRSDALVFGNISNLASPIGVVSISDTSSVTLTGNLINTGSIVLAADSELFILGTLAGNGVSGSDGGPSGPVFVSGGISPGPIAAPGPALFDGDVSIGAGGTTTIEIASPSSLDRIGTGAQLSVGGTLTVTLVDGYVPQPGDVYDVLDFASLTGSFSSVQLDQALIDAGADVSDLLVTGEIRVPGELCPGDVDGDNDTDVFDFAELALAFGTMPGDTNWNPDADLVPNGTIDVFDFATLAEDFGCWP